MDFKVLAGRVAGRSIEAARKPRRLRRTSKPRKEMLSPSTEFSCQVDISLSADFEGSVAESALKKKLKNELVAAIKAGIVSTARGFNLQATGVLVKPLRIDCAVNDQSSIEDDIDSVD
jgi:hypothetical protein